MQIYKSKKWPPLLNSCKASVVCSKLLLTYLPSYRFWRSTLIDLGAPSKNSTSIKTTHPFPPPPPPPRYAYFRTCLKKLWGPPSQIFWAPPPKVCPSPPLGKILRTPMVTVIYYLCRHEFPSIEIILCRFYTETF